MSKILVYFWHKAKGQKCVDSQKSQKFWYNFWHFWSNYGPFCCCCGIFWIFVALLLRHMSKMLKNNRRFLTDTIDFWKFRDILDIFDICQKFRSFCFNFCKIFDRWKSSIFLKHFWLLKVRQCRNTVKVERPKFSGKRMALVT